MILSQKILSSVRETVIEEIKNLKKKKKSLALNHITMAPTTFA